MKSKQSSKLCDFLTALAKYNLFLLPDGSPPAEYGIQYKIVQPRSNKSAILGFSPMYFTREQDGEVFEHRSSFHDSECDCLKKVANETENPGNVLQSLTEMQCAIEKCFQTIDDEKKDELNNLYLEDPAEFCLNDAAEKICECFENEYYPLKDKHFPVIYHEEVKEYCVEENCEEE